MVLGPGAQYFSIYLPSATTVSFTVSTRPLYAPTSTKTLRSLLSRVPVLSLIKHIFRVLLISFALLANLAKVEDVLRSPIVNAYTEFWLRVSLLGGFVKLLAEKTEWWILVPVSLGIVYVCLKRDYVGTFVLTWRNYCWMDSNCRNRGIPSSPAGLGDSNVYFFSLLLHRGDNDVHPNHSDSGYCYP